MRIQRDIDEDTNCYLVIPLNKNTSFFPSLVKVYLKKAKQRLKMIVDKTIAAARPEFYKFRCSDVAKWKKTYKHNTHKFLFVKILIREYKLWFVIKDMLTLSLNQI